MRQRSGGVGVSLMAHRGQVAYMARTVDVVRAVLGAMPQSHTDVLQPSILQTASVIGLRQAVQASREFNLTQDELQSTTGSGYVGSITARRRDGRSNDSMAFL